MSRSMKKSFRPHVEALEDRLVPANYLILDYTPDTGHSAFASAFNARYTNTNTAPRFLDMNGDGWVNNYDVQLGAKYVADRVAGMLAGFNIQVRYGDVLQNTNFGRTWLRHGVGSAQNQVFCIYVGGWSGNDRNGSFMTGVAPLAPVGYNNETYGHTFASSLTQWLMPQSGVTAAQFVNHLAVTTVHEFGHLIGLGHTYRHPTGGVNIMSYGTDARYARLPNANYLTNLYSRTSGSFVGWQNPAAEVVRSLSGQPTYAAYGYNHFHQVGAHDHDHDHDHDHEGDALADPQRDATTDALDAVFKEKSRKDAPLSAPIETLPSTTAEKQAVPSPRDVSAVDRFFASLATTPASDTADTLSPAGIASLFQAKRGRLG